MKIAIIGATAAGITLATRLRRLSEDANISLYEKKSSVGNATCCIPYFLSSNCEFDKLVGRPLNTIKEWFNIDIFTDTEVVEINSDKKYIKSKNLKDNTIVKEHYDKLVLATGTTPVKVDVENIDKVKNIFYVSDIYKADEIKKALEGTSKKILLVGGGNIGLELTEGFLDAGHKVSLVEKNNQLAQTVDYEMSTVIEKELESAGVMVTLNREIKSFSNDGKRAILDNNNFINFDVLVYAIGNRPNLDLAKKVGIKVGDKGGIKVNKKFQTSIKDIYAVGDVIENYDKLTNKKFVHSNALVANNAARELANILINNKGFNKGVIKTGIAKVRELQVAWVGENEKELKRQKIKYEEIRSVLPTHTECFSKASDMKVKVFFDKKSKKIYGAQAIGKEGADKFIDTIASIMGTKNNILLLKDLELCYAPPYNTVKTPVNKIGYIAENVINNTDDRIFLENFEEGLKTGTILDVRDEEELKKFEIEDATFIPLSQIRKNISKIRKLKEPIYILCLSGMRAYFAHRILANNNIKSKVIDGGITSYKLFNYKNQKGE